MKRIGFADSVMMDALFPCLLVILFEKAAVLGGFLFAYRQIDETHRIAV